MPKYQIPLPGAIHTLASGGKAKFIAHVTDAVSADKFIWMDLSDKRCFGTTAAGDAGSLSITDLAPVRKKKDKKPKYRWYTDAEMEELLLAKSGIVVVRKKCSKSRPAAGAITRGSQWFFRVWATDLPDTDGMNFRDFEIFDATRGWQPVGVPE